MPHRQYLSHILAFSVVSYGLNDVCCFCEILCQDTSQDTLDISVSVILTLRQAVQMHGVTNLTCALFKSPTRFLIIRYKLICGLGATDTPTYYASFMSAPRFVAGVNKLASAGLNTYKKSEKTVRNKRWDTFIQRLLIMATFSWR